VAEIKIRLTDEEMAAAHEWSQSVPLAALVKHLLIEAIRPYLTPNRGRSGVDLGRAQNGVDLGSIRGQSEPGTELALSSSQKEKEKTKNKKKGRPPRIAPLPISERIIGYLNQLAGTKLRPEAEGHRVHIQRRLNKGATVEQMLTVVRKQVADWKGTDMARHLVPETLFGGKFDKYLDRPEPSMAKRTHQQSLPATSARRGMGDDEGYTDGTW
jgi:uncharacterized phage protein (TIGR02220 family)